MKFIPYALIALCVCASAHGESVNDSIVGTYEFNIGKPANSVDIRLECESETNCAFTTTTQRGSNPPRQDKQLLNKVRRVEDLTFASNALKYAINQQSKDIKNEELAELMRKLHPALSSTPSVEKCWDLNYPSPGYMLACTFSNTPAENPPIFLFGTLLANCGEAFCRYVIYPMSRER